MSSESVVNSKLYR